MATIYCFICKGYNLASHAYGSCLASGATLPRPVAERYCPTCAEAHAVYYFDPARSVWVAREKRPHSRSDLSSRRNSALLLPFCDPILN